MENACGLGVHKDSVFVCVLDAQGNKILEKRYQSLPMICIFPDNTSINTKKDCPGWTVLF